MKKRRLLLLLSVLFLGALTDCKKESINEGGNGNGEIPDNPAHYEVDLSYKRYLEYSYVGIGGSSLCEFKHIYQYDGNKEIGYKRYKDGVLTTEYNNYNYSGLSRTNTFCSYFPSGYYESEWYLEYLDDTYLHPLYAETRENGIVISKTIYEYEGNKCMGIKQYLNDILIEESTNYLWEDNKSSYRKYQYNQTNGSIECIYDFFIEYIDENYSRVWHSEQVTISFFGGNEKVTKIEYNYQYAEDGKRRIGMQEYENNILREEYKNCVYNGNKCTFTQCIYDNNGQLQYEGEGYVVYYNP